MKKAIKRQVKNVDLSHILKIAKYQILKRDFGHSNGFFTVSHHTIADLVMRDFEEAVIGRLSFCPSFYYVNNIVLSAPLHQLNSIVQIFNSDL